MVLGSMDWLEQAARAFEPVDPTLPATPLDQARELDERFRLRPHLTYLSDRLTQAVRDVEQGQSRQIAVMMPPRMGKTTLATIYTPLWILRQHPDWPIALTSHDGRLATSWGRQIRRFIEQHPALGVRIAKDAGAASEWETTTGGKVLSISVRESFTGRGAKCLVGDTHILTDRGRITAEDAFTNGISRILAYDHLTKRPVWRTVEAAQRTRRRGLVEVTTTSGRLLTCTPDHPVYTSRGYVPAGDLRVRDALVAVVDADGVPSLRHDLPTSTAGRPQGDPTSPESLLLPGVRRPGTSRHTTDPLVPVRPAGPPQHEVLFGTVPHRRPNEAASTQADQLPRMRHDLPAEKPSSSLLLPRVRQHRPFTPHVPEGQQQLARRHHPVHSRVPEATPADPETRWPPMRGLWPESDSSRYPQWSSVRADSPDRASHQRGQARQPTREPHHVVPDMPCRPPQVTSDTVAMVRNLGDREIPVYDFQVEGTRNFFANDVLVHNCLVLDDVHKDFVDAHSATSRQTVWDWYRTVAKLRLEPPSLTVAIMTRWHEDDMIGRLLSTEHEGDPADCEVIRFPALAEEADVLGRVPGEPLLSPLIDETPDEAIMRWEKIRTDVGSYAWASLMQQRPAPAKGAIFDTSWWRFWTCDPGRVTDGDDTVVFLDPDTDLAGARWLDSWDCAFKGTDASDYVVGQRWARKGADRYLIAQQRGRWSFTQTLGRMRDWANGGGPHGQQVHERLVEDKANGTAVIDVLKREVAGMIPVNPTNSKEARARAVTPEIEAGNVYLPHPADPGNEWVNDALAELREFNHGAHDDVVDALTQALTRLRDSGRGQVTVPGQGGGAVVQRDYAAAARSAPRRTSGTASGRTGRVRIPGR